MSEVYSRLRAGRWFLDSGIQQPSGGVARFYLADREEYKPISTEITGYAASALAYLYCATKNEEYLDRARLTAHFLIDRAWDSTLRLFPFELKSNLAFFFDSGIIVRGLLAVWRITKEQRLLDIAVAAAQGMLTDFNAGSDYHPILELPDKRPHRYHDHWSRSPGCYQAKSALAWWEVAEITGDEKLRQAYLALIDALFETYGDFLPGTVERFPIMDRLHAASYFLEGLSPLLDRPECADAYRFTIKRISHYLSDIAPDFVRSDVYAQLLRARVQAAAVIPVDTERARAEAHALATFQRMDGGFYFGRRSGEIVPHVNPVSTAFAIQALDVWRAFENKEPDPCLYPTI